MNLKRIIGLLIWPLLILFFSEIIFAIWAQTENTSIQLAISNHPLATAYNNGRRIVRDGDCGRYIVYQDMKRNIPIICFCRSNDGKNWTPPDTIAEGEFPSIAVDKFNRLHLVWQGADTSAIFFTYSEDLGTNWRFPPMNVSGSSSLKTQFPVIEAGQRLLHIAWQQDVCLQPRRCVQEIFYASLSFDSLGSFFTTPINISRSEHDSQFPSIAYNLTFVDGKLHVVWYDFARTDSIDFSMIMYRAVDEKLATWDPPLSLHPYILSENCGDDAVHPAISVEAGEFAHVVWGHGQKDKFHSFLFNLNHFSSFSPIEIQTTADPFICVDDVFLKSSALVWMNNNEIYYMQSLDARLISQEYIPVSQVDDTQSMYPSVCYKHFRDDSLDVIWTDGNAPPYKIMYRRMEKFYSSQEVKRKDAANQTPQKFELKQNYPNPFNESTFIRFDIPELSFVTLEIYNLPGQKVRTLISDESQPGTFTIHWDGKDDSGHVLGSGIYCYRLCAGDFVDAKRMVLLR